MVGMQVGKEEKEFMKMLSSCVCMRQEVLGKQTSVRQTRSRRL